MRKSLLSSIVCVFALLSLVGCTSPNPYGDSYGSTDTRSIQQVIYGTVVKVAPVTIEASEQSNALGTVAGAALGGLLGSKVGSGSGSDVAAVGGGLLGGYLGSNAGSAAGKRNGVSLTIRLEDGRDVNIVQEANPNMLFNVGQEVQITLSGRTARVVPR